jgi:hypothetical protein
MTALAPVSRARSAISLIARSLAPLQLPLVGGGTAADDVADAGEHVLEGVRTQDRLPGHNPLVLVDVPVLECAGRRQKHALPPACA